MESFWLLMELWITNYVSGRYGFKQIYFRSSYHSGIIIYVLMQRNFEVKIELIAHFFKCFQTASTSLFGIGSQQTKCVKSYASPPVNIAPNTNPLKLARLIWVDPRTVVLLTVDGTETKFRV